MSSLAEGVLAGDRRALARAITLVESTREDHQEQAAGVLGALMGNTGAATRIGVSGAPGVGKSTFIEAFGTYVTSIGHKVAVLAVDPSSARSGGSILGDKTRMSELARDPNAFIRPSPSGGSLGGVARRTREAMLVCEAAGFDVVLVETVGVGQSETTVNDMVDVFVLLASPGGGDELQGIKRGIMELADIVVVTKADGALLAAARQACADYRMALHLLRRKVEAWEPRVLLASATAGEGVAETWDAVVEHQQVLAQTGALAGMRAEQSTAWMWREVQDRLLDSLREDPAVAAALPELERRVAAGEVTPTAAADELVRRVQRR